jgi:hypothetical protein
MMKIKVILVGLVVVALLFLAGSMAYAEVADYQLSWWTVDGGGGTSNSSTYDLSGTIGQPDAGHMSGGGYVLVGGFWGGSRAKATDNYRVHLPIVLGQ